MAKELLDHRQVDGFDELSDGSSGFGCLQPGVDWFQLLPRQRLHRTLIRIGGTNRGEFLVDVNPNPDAVPNLVFPESQDPVPTTMGDGPSLHKTLYNDSGKTAFQSAYRATLNPGFGAA
jgi:hypothetical protein